MKKILSEKVYVFKKTLKRDDEFCNLSSIIKTVSKDETRVWIMGINVTEDRIIATDGRRLHFMNNDGLIDPGYYDVELCTAKKIILSLNAGPVDIPNYNRVIPNRSGMKSIMVSKDKDHDLLFINEVIIKTGFYFNISYLEGLPNGGYELFYHENDFSKAVMFCGRITAVIMPILRAESKILLRSV